MGLFILGLCQFPFCFLELSLLALLALLDLLSAVHNASPVPKISWSRKTTEEVAMYCGKNLAVVAEFQLFSTSLRDASVKKTEIWVIKETNHNGLNSGISAL